MWKDVIKLLDKYKGMAKVSIHDGKTCLLWDDVWNGIVPHHIFHEQHSLKKKNITTVEAKSATNLHSLFYVPMPEEASSNFFYSYRAPLAQFRSQKR